MGSHQGTTHKPLCGPWGKNKPINKQLYYNSETRTVWSLLVALQSQPGRRNAELLEPAERLQSMGRQVAPMEMSKDRWTWLYWPLLACRQVDLNTLKWDCLAPWGPKTNLDPRNIASLVFPTVGGGVPESYQLLHSSSRVLLPQTAGWEGDPMLLQGFSRYNIRVKSSLSLGCFSNHPLQS